MRAETKLRKSKFPHHVTGVHVINVNHHTELIAETG